MRKRIAITDRDPHKTARIGAAFEGLDRTGHQWAYCQRLFSRGTREPCREHIDGNASEAATRQIGVGS
jgi:hypothetical protein